MSITDFEFSFPSPLSVSVYRLKSPVGTTIYSYPEEEEFDPYISKDSFSFFSKSQLKI